jgi:hypothetical protein
LFGIEFFIIMPRYLLSLCPYHNFLLENSSAESIAKHTAVAPEIISIGANSATAIPPSSVAVASQAQTSPG